MLQEVIYQIFNQCALPAMTYGGESWKFSRKDEEKKENR